jgi:hypothetical protein
MSIQDKMMHVFDIYFKDNHITKTLRVLGVHSLSSYNITHNRAITPT